MTFFIRQWSVAAVAVFVLSSSGCSALEPMSQGREAIANGDMAGAVAHYQKLIAAEPKNVEAYAGLAQAQESLGAYVKAQQTWLKVIELDPAYINAYLTLGDLNLKQQNIAMAAMYFQEALVRSKPESVDAVAATRGLDVIIAQSPYYRERILKARAKILNEQLNGRKAKMFYDRINAGKAMFAEGNTFFNDAQYEQALQSFNGTLQLIPGHPAAMRMRQASILALRKEHDNQMTDIAIQNLIHHE